MSKTFNGIIGVASANAFSALIYIAATPLLTRLYDPDAFGLFGVAMSFLVIVGAVSAYGADKLAMTERSPDLLLPILFKGVVFTVFSVSIILMASLLLREALPKANILHEFNVFLVFVGLLATSSLNLLLTWHLRAGSERFIACSRVIQATVTTVAQFLCYDYENGLLVGYVLGTVSGASLLIASRNLWKSILVMIRTSNLTPFRLYHNSSDHYFGLRYIGIVLLNNFNSIFVPVVIMVLYGPVEAGFYHLAIRVFSLPNSVLGKYVGDRFVADVSGKNEGGWSLASEFWRYTRPLIVISILSFIFVVMIPSWIWVSIFGEQWNGVKTSMVLVALMQLSFFGLSAVRFELMRKLDIGLRLSMLRVIVTCSVMLTAFLFEFGYETFLFILVLSAVSLQVLKIKVFINSYFKKQEA